MSEVKAVSKITKNSCMDSQLYGFITDFRNIGLLLPPEIQDKVSYTKDSITMEAMPGMSVTLIIRELTPHTCVKYGADGAQDFTIWVQLKQIAPYDTRIRVTLHAEIPVMAKMFGRKKLQQFVDGFAEALAKIPTIALQANTFN